MICDLAHHNILFKWLINKSSHQKSYDEKELLISINNIQNF
ncbi:hypothetical protein [Moraxella lacunata]